ncbi:MAG: cation:proton antiporter, partial [Nitrososphaerales archaeon]
AGMMVASARKSDVIVERILPLRDFFGTIFFVSVGMLVSFNVLLDYAWVSIPIVVVAILGKLVTNFFSAFLVGHSREEATTIGILMVPRGEFSYVIAKQGVDLGAAREAIYPITVVVSFASMVIIPALMKFLPTVIDSKTILPPRVFIPLEVLGNIFRSYLSSLQRKESVTEVTRKLIPKLIVNIAIIAVLLSALSLSDPYIRMLYQTFSSLQIVSYEIFKLILTVVVIAYPVVTIFGKTGQITESLFDATQYRIVKAPIVTGGMHYLHRIIRNVVTGMAVLLISSFITPSLSVITNIEIILPISSLVTLGVFVYLILDTFFVINRRMERSIMSSLHSARDVEEKERIPNQDETKGSDANKG